MVLTNLFQGINQWNEPVMFHKQLPVSGITDIIFCFADIINFYFDK